MSSRTLIDRHGKSARRMAGEGAMAVILRGVAEGFRRARQRRDLAALSEHALRDIGLSRADVDFELRKPFWRA